MRIAPRPLALPAQPGVDPAQDAKLRKSALQMEGVFVQQMYKAMRETVPHEGGIVDGGSGEEMFTGMLDERMAADTPNQWKHGLGEAIYRQLRSALPGAQSPTIAPDPVSTPVTQVP